MYVLARWIVKTVDTRVIALARYPLKVHVALIYAVNTMIPPGINYVQHYGSEKSDSIISLKLLTTMSIEISILFKIVKNSLVIEV